MSSLKESFAYFTKETSRLEVSYKALQEKFKELHNQLESYSATLSTIAAHMSEGLIFVSVNGNIELFNGSASTLTGHPHNSIFQTSYWEHFTDAFFGFSMEKALKEAAFHARKTIVSFQSDTLTYDVEVSSSFIPKKGILLLLRDLTEERHLQKALSRNDRLRDLGEIAAALAHEIRNPLGGIQGFASLLSRDLKDFPQQKAMATAILEGTQALNRLVSNVLNYARPLEVHFALCDAALLIYETATLINVDKSSTSNIKLALPEESYLINVDKELLKMALLNLIQNALYASPEPYSVIISLEKKEGFICIVISDKGPGIAKDQIEKIFLPFFTTKPSGTGLGLSEAQKIVHAQGGTIEVFSEKKIGSTFIIKVPSYASD